MARKKKHEEHVNHERWLVSYADFITLLFAFFVTLYAISQVDAKKLGKLMQSMQAAFESRVFEPGSPKLSLSDGRQKGLEQQTLVEPISPLVNPSPSMQAIEAAIRSKLIRQRVSELVRLRQEKRGLVVVLDDQDAGLGLGHAFLPRNRRCAKRIMLAKSGSEAWRGARFF